MDEALKRYLEAGWQYSHSQYIEEFGRIVGEVKWYSHPASSSWLVFSPDLDGEGASLRFAPALDVTYRGGLVVGSGVKCRL